MKNKKKLVGVLIIAFIIFICLCSSVHGTIITPGDYNPNVGTTTAVSSFSTLMKKIVSLVQLIGSGVSIITIAIIAIKYMLGSVQDKAEYKKSLVPYFVGSIFVFSIVNILAIVEKMVNSVI